MWFKHSVMCFRIVFQNRLLQKKKTQHVSAFLEICANASDYVTNISQEHLHNENHTILSVPDQNGVSQAWYIVQIHHSGQKPLIYTQWKSFNFSNQLKLLGSHADKTKEHSSTYQTIQHSISTIQIRDVIEEAEGHRTQSLCWPLTEPVNGAAVD